MNFEMPGMAGGLDSMQRLPAGDGHPHASPPFCVDMVGVSSPD